MNTKPSKPALDPLTTLLADSKLDEAQALATSLFDLNARTRAIAQVALARLALKQTQQGLALVDEVAVVALQVFAPSQGLLVLTDVLSRALEAAPEPRVLLGFSASVERAFFRLAAHLLKVDSYASFDVQRAQAPIQSLYDPQPLRSAFAVLLELYIPEDPQRAVQMMRLYATDNDRLHLVPKCTRDSDIGRTITATAPNIEESALERLLTRGLIDTAIPYLWARLGDQDAEDAALGDCVQVIGEIMTHRLEAGRFEEAAQILSDLATKRPRMTSGLGTSVVAHLGALADHDIALALRCLDLLDEAHLQEARAIMSKLIAARAAKGDKRVLDQGVKAIGEDVLPDAFSCFLEGSDYTQADAVAKRMRPPKQFECLVTLSIVKRDFAALASAMKRWLAFEEKSLPQHDAGAGKALRHALPVIEKSGDWSVFETVLTLGVAHKALQAETIAAGYWALMRRALADKRAKETMQYWRRFVEQRRRTPESDQRPGHYSYSQPVQLGVLSSAEKDFGVKLAKWLLGGPDMQGGLEVAKDAWDPKALLEYLTGEGKKAVGAGDKKAATRLLNAAEDLARESADFATLAMIGNLFLRSGDQERGRVAQCDAQALDEKRKADEQRWADEEYRRQMDDD